MKVAAYQAPLRVCGSMDAIDLIRIQVDRSQSAGVEILCCPEGMIGGLADYATRPTAIAIEFEGGRLNEVLAPLASNTVTTIVGFTEIDRGLLYNSAAVFHKGSVVGLYRKLYPAINRSIYAPGNQIPVFTVGTLTFGILICLDSNYYEPARLMASKGAVALFILTNNGLPPAKADPALVVAQARNADIARAIENRVSVIRADVAGRTPDLVSYGSSEIVNPDGMLLGSASRFSADLVVADIETAPRARRRGWDASENGFVRDQYVRLVLNDCGEENLFHD